MFGKDAVIISLKLFIITAIAALCLAFVNKVTAPIIETNSNLAKTESLNNVLEADEFSEPDILGTEAGGVTIEEVYTGKKDDETAGFVVIATSHEGYGGDISVMVGIDSNIQVTRIEILESSETAGLGANASKPKFTDQFKGASNMLEVVKGDADVGQISAISSATVTSKAVTGCVNASLNIIKEKYAKGGTK